VEEYFIEFCRDTGDTLECDRILISELPYQKHLIQRLAVLGAIDVEDGMLPADQVDRVAKILRLRNLFGVNLSGAAIICDLLNRLEDLEKQIDRLKNR